MWMEPEPISLRHRVLRANFLEGQAHGSLVLAIPWNAAGQGVHQGSGMVLLPPWAWNPLGSLIDQQALSNAQLCGQACVSGVVVSPHRSRGWAARTLGGSKEHFGF